MKDNAGDTVQAVVQPPRHPYLRPLASSAPTLANGSISRAQRDRLRAELQHEEVIKT